MKEWKSYHFLARAKLRSLAVFTEVVCGGVVVDFRLRTEPTMSFFRKTEPPTSPILEKLFSMAENLG
jgi:hypothetical protein